MYKWERDTDDKKKRKGAVGCAENGEENTFRQKKTKAAAGGELQMEKAEDAANLPFPPPLHFLSTYLNWLPVCTIPYQICSHLSSASQLSQQQGP